MWAPKVSLALCALLQSNAARVKRERASSKMVAGVPVLNYDKAFARSSKSGLETVEDWVLVTKKGVPDAQMMALCKSTPMCLSVGHPDQGGVRFVEFRGTEEDLEQALEASQGMVEFAEPDGVVSMIPEIKSDVHTAAAPWGLERIGAKDSATTGEGVNVFVLDTGIRRTHQDFGGRVVPTLDMTGDSLKVCDEADFACAGDAQGHGTHCAGTAAGASYGVPPGATLRTVKVLSDSGSGSWSWSYKALDFLATSEFRPAVASMSLGGAGTQSAMEVAVDDAVSAGIVVVVAGGNDNSDACGFSPAFVPSAITVGSTTSRDARSDFSNYGTCTDIWAPGSDIRSAQHTSDTGSVEFSGTSMACPHVSGAAALLLEESPGLSSSAVISTLLDGAYANVIRDLKPGDTNKLLYVGAESPPAYTTLAPTPAPPPPPPCPDNCQMWYACYLSRCSSCSQCN